MARHPDPAGAPPAARADAPARPRRLALIPPRQIALLAGLALTSCAEDATVLPVTWNTLKQRELSVDIFAATLGPVRALHGINGAPGPHGDGLPDVTESYWTRPGGAQGEDGAHLDVVRVGPFEDCALGLDALLPDPFEPPDRPQSYAFEALDRLVGSAAETRGEGVIVALDFGTGCGPSQRQGALASPQRWAEALANITRHLTAGDTWDPQGHRFPVALIELLPFDELPQTGPQPDSERALFALWEMAARNVRTLTPEIAIGGGGVTLEAPLVPESALARFIVLAASRDLPLEVLTLGARGTPAEITAIAASVRAALDDAGLEEVDLALTSMERRDRPYADRADCGRGEDACRRLDRADLGAHEMATRLRLQAVPVRWALSGLGPPQLRDGVPSESEYFDLRGIATPAFMARLPMRQIAGEQRLPVTLGSGEELTALASTDGDSLSIVLAHPASLTGVASVEYALVLPAFAPPQFGSVAFRRSELDASNDGIGSFFFSDLVDLPLDPATGDVVIRRTLSVPGVQLLEIDRPL